MLLFSVSVGDVLLNSIYFDRISFFGSLFGGVFIRLHILYILDLTFILSLFLSIHLCLSVWVFAIFFLNCIFFFIFPFVYCLFCCIHISVFMQLVILNVIKLFCFCLAFGSWLYVLLVHGIFAYAFSDLHIICSMCWILFLFHFNLVLFSYWTSDF